MEIQIKILQNSKKTLPISFRPGFSKRLSPLENISFKQNLRIIYRFSIHNTHFPVSLIAFFLFKIIKQINGYCLTFGNYRKVSMKIKISIISHMTVSF